MAATTDASCPPAHTSTQYGTDGRARRYAVRVAALAVFATAILFELPRYGQPINDHFMHVVLGRQMLFGRLPLRDMVEPGMVLQAGLSALAERIVGYRMLSEAIIGATAIAVAAVTTLFLATRASGTVIVGLIAAMLQIAAAPRTYSYPKILLYAVGIGLLWRYIDRPTPRRAAALAALVVGGFLLRHDHGLYLGVATAVVLIARHAGDWRSGLRPAGTFLTGCGLAALPFLAYVSLQQGLGSYLADLRMFATREAQQNRLEALPQWPIRTFGDIARWEPAKSVAVPISIRWDEAASDDIRVSTAERYGLLVPKSGGVVSGAYILTNIEHENVLALVRDPAIEDTGGIDRRTGVINRPGLRIGALNLLASLDDTRRAASFLVYVMVFATMLQVLVLLTTDARHSPLGDRPRLKMWSVVILSAFTMAGFIREPLDGRVSDAVVPALIVLACLVGVVRSRVPASGRYRYVAIAILVLVLSPVARAITRVGDVPWATVARPAGDQSRSDQWTAIRRQLWASPPITHARLGDVGMKQLVNYVRACTPDQAPLLVLWFEPEFYYYTDRPFAGRLPFYLRGYWTSPEHERANLAQLKRDPPLIVISERGHDSHLQTYPMLVRYLLDSYELVGELPGHDGMRYRVHVRNDATPTAVEASSGWPCYR